MKTVTIQLLKQNLSAILSQATAGVRFIVTRHRRPVAEIGPTQSSHLQIGEHFGKTHLRPACKAATGGQYLDVLAEDRSGLEPPGEAE